MVTDFFIAFCLRYFDLLSNRLGNGYSFSNEILNDINILRRNCPLEVPIAIGIRGVVGLYLIFEVVLDFYFETQIEEIEIILNVIFSNFAKNLIPLRYNLHRATLSCLFRSFGMDCVERAAQRCFTCLNF